MECWWSAHLKDLKVNKQWITLACLPHIIQRLHARQCFVIVYNTEGKKKSLAIQRRQSYEWMSSISYDFINYGKARCQCFSAGLVFHVDVITGGIAALGATLLSVQVFIRDSSYNASLSNGSNNRLLIMATQTERECLCYCNLYWIFLKGREFNWNGRGNPREFNLNRLFLGHSIMKTGGMWQHTSLHVGLFRFTAFGH